MMLFRFLVTLFLVMFAGNYASAQTCESIFNTSVLSKFKMEDQETLTTLARKQVELSFNFNISKVQKDAALNHLAEQLEIFIAESRLTTQQEQTLRQEYRALVFQFKKELTGELDNQTRTVSEKKKALDQQIEDQLNFPLTNLMVKYKIDNPNLLLHAILNTFTVGRTNDFKLALSIKEIDDINKQGALHTAILHEPVFVEALIKSPKLDVNLRNESGSTAFEIALNTYSQYRALSITFAKLISSHPSFDPNIINKNSITLFQSAIIISNPKIAYILASHPKFDLFSKDSSGWTPLHLSYKYPELAKLLFSRGADIEARDNLGNTPLHIATHNVTSISSVELLINGGADVNAKNKSGRTALYLAVSADNLKAVELLLKAKGTDVNIKDKWNETPLKAALRGDSTKPNRRRIINLLESKGATQ